MRRPSLSLKRLIRTTAVVGAAAGGLGAALAGGAASADGAAVVAGVPSCQTAGLVVWLDTQSNGTAGTTFYTLEFTNLSGHTCTLRGYPGVSAIGLQGQLLGKAARRNNVRPVKTIKLKNGATATTAVGIADAGNFSPSTCGPVTAAGLRVFPPNQGASKTVPFPFAACSRAGILSVRTIR